jgi:hypothetical protein
MMGALGDQDAEVKPRPSLPFAGLPEFTLDPAQLRTARAS